MEVQLLMRVIAKMLPMNGILETETRQPVSQLITHTPK